MFDHILARINFSSDNDADNDAQDNDAQDNDAQSLATHPPSSRSPIFFWTTSWEPVGILKTGSPTSKNENTA